MVRRIQALNYRCLRHVDVRLDGNFHILVGPNASGKSTLLDVIGFFADLTPGSLENTVRRRVPDFTDLVWGRRGTGQRFELAIELDAEASSEDGAQGAVRYELAVCGDKDGPRIETVQGLAMGASVDEPRSARRFPEPLEPVPSLLSSRPVQDTRVLFRGDEELTDYMDEVQSRLARIDPLLEGGLCGSSQLAGRCRAVVLRQGEAFGPEAGAEGRAPQDSDTTVREAVSEIGRGRRP